MIFDNLKNKDSYLALPEIAAALRYLSSLNLETLPTEKKELGNCMFAFSEALTTKPAAQCCFEAHRRFIDVHCTFSGCEVISYGEVGDMAEVAPYSAEKDIAFYEGVPKGFCEIYPGDFMVCWPQDAHRPSQMKDVPGALRKVVVKIPVE